MSIGLPMKAIICCCFNVIIATVNPVDALGLQVQCDTGWPAQFAPDDAIAVGAIHIGPLQPRLSVQRIPVREEHKPEKERGRTWNQGSLHQGCFLHLCFMEEARQAFNQRQEAE